LQEEWNLKELTSGRSKSGPTFFSKRQGRTTKVDIFGGGTGGSGCSPIGCGEWLGDIRIKKEVDHGV